MTPQERQMVDELFDRLSKVEGAPRDRDASVAISEGLSRAPNALYTLVQTVLVQDEALKRADARIQELENAGAPEQPQGGFLDTMRDTLFGQSQPRGSVPNVRPPEPASRPAWNTGQVLQQSQRGDRYDQGQPYNQGQYNQAPPGQPYGAPQAPMGGGGSFLGTAAAAAAGAVGGGLLMNSIRSMMGGGHQSSFGDSAGLGGGKSPWSTGSDQSGGNLARDAGVNDVGTSGHTSSFDQAQADADQDQDQDQDDDDDFANSDSDDDSDFA